MSVTAPQGFVAGAVACGVKGIGIPDLALVATEDGEAVPAAAVFTTNLAAAGPVEVSRSHLRRNHGRAAAVILNSGNANACTPRGRDDAERMCDLVADNLGCQSDDVLVCSTGLIGIPLPIGLIEAGIPGLVRSRSRDSGKRAAVAIMTTDTVAKQSLVRGNGFTVGGMAKGAAMLSPDMATMLAVLTTDAVTDPSALQAALTAAVDRSFNELTVDGATSTNDTVIVLANGRSGRRTNEEDLADALWEACADLAAQMAADAEGGTKVVRVRVMGAATADQAAAGARRVAENQLIKCSWYGEDPYWGRIVSELGASSIAFDLDRVSVSYNGIIVCAKGVESRSYDPDALKAAMAQRTIEIVADLGLGDGEASVLTTDLSHRYIDENMRTS
jgi:glutamate N-acetyltransferase/amino-acid N-acetyltransferase